MELENAKIILGSDVCAAVQLFLSSKSCRQIDYLRERIVLSEDVPEQETGF
jgi:hypothetical protein